MRPVTSAQANPTKGRRRKLLDMKARTAQGKMISSSLGISDDGGKGTKKISKPKFGENVENRSTESEYQPLN